VISLGLVGDSLSTAERSTFSSTLGLRPPRPQRAPRRVAANDTAPAAAPPPRVANRRLAVAARLGVIGADAAVILSAMAGAYALCRPLEGASGYRQVSLVSVPLWLVVFYRYSLYNSRHVASCRLEFGRVLHGVGVGVPLTALVAAALGQVVVRQWLVLVFLLTGGGVMAERMVVRGVFACLRRRGYFVRRVAVVGTGQEGAALVATLNAQTELGYRVVGLLGDGQALDPLLAAQLPVLPLGADPVEQLRSLGAGGVVMATTEVNVEVSNRLVRSLTDAGIHVELSSSLKDIDADRIVVRPLGCFPMMYVEAVKRGGWRPAAKRAFDIVVSLTLILLSAPVMALAALAVKATSPGPLLFRQERVGWRGQRFLIFKLRSMYVDGDERLAAAVVDVGAAPVVKLRNDPRVTWCGRLLRKLSLDELPQLLNVLRGEMSLVGPRPEQPCEALLWTPEQFDRLRVRPGLTGMWQISGRSDARDMKDRLDLCYVDNWSIWRDTAILLKTPPAVLSFKGAY